MTLFRRSIVQIAQGCHPDAKGGAHVRDAKVGEGATRRWLTVHDVAGATSLCSIHRVQPAQRLDFTRCATFHLQAERRKWID
jgi:hypothetical protein